MPLNLLFNATNVQSGGAMQVALSLLSEWSKLSDIKIIVAASPQLQLYLKPFIQLPHIVVHQVAKNPTQGIWAMKQNQKTLNDLVRKYQCQVVFTVFGPAWWKPSVPHLCGFANGYYLFDQSYFITQVVSKHLRGRMSYKMNRALVLNRLRYEADRLWVETNTAQEWLSQTLSIAANKITVAGNTFSSFFNDADVAVAAKAMPFSLLIPSAYYKHKQFEILPKLHSVLLAKGVAVQFLVTLPAADYKRVFGGSTKMDIVNLGVLSPQEYHHAYNRCHAVFLPTLLEIFSSAYPEAMKMQRPILTSDLWFAHEVCGAAALYFDPLSVQDMADKIVRIIKEAPLRMTLINAGNERLQSLPTAAIRAQLLMSVIKELTT